MSYRICKKIYLGANLRKEFVECPECKNIILLEHVKLTKEQYFCIDCGLEIMDDASNPAKKRYLSCKRCGKDYFRGLPPTIKCEKCGEQVQAEENRLAVTSTSKVKTGPVA